jgi:predicted HTH domain antitoxin
MTQKSALISLRLEKQSINDIKEISNIEKLEKSVIYRQAIKKGLKEIKKELALRLFAEEEYTLSQAADFADMYLGDFMELLSKRGISQDVSLDVYKQGGVYAEKFLKSLKLSSKKKKIGL